MDILTALLVGTSGALIALMFEHLYLHFREKNKENKLKLVKFPNEERIIDDSIFYSLKHGASVELMKSVLGTPDRILKYDEPVFRKSIFDGVEELLTEEELESETDYEEGLGYKTNSYLYKFKNADVKITSKDCLIIDSLTVIANDQSISFGYLLFPWNQEKDNRFNKTKVTKEMVEMCRSEYIQSRWDNIFVLSFYAASPTYDFYTYFGYLDYDESNKITEIESSPNFVNGTIIGVCLSQNDTDIYYVNFQDRL